MGGICTASDSVNSSPLPLPKSVNEHFISYVFQGKQLRAFIGVTLKPREDQHHNPFNISHVPGTLPEFAAILTTELQGQGLSLGIRADPVINGDNMYRQVFTQTLTKNVRFLL